MVSSAEGTRTGHYKWCLPEQAGLVRHALRPSNFGGERGESQERFACAAVELKALAPNVFFESEHLARVYSDRLTALDLLEISGKPCLTDCIPLILKSAAPLRALEELTTLPGTEDGVRAYVSRLCWRPPVRMHPFLHLFTIVWLFGNWESFWSIVKIKFESVRSWTVNTLTCLVAIATRCVVGHFASCGSKNLGVHNRPGSLPAHAARGAPGSKTASR